MRPLGDFLSLCGTKSPGRWVATALIAVLVLPGIASGAQVTLVDLEDEVMCPICGTLLELSNAPQAERQRALINRLIAAGRTKAEIKDALVAQYGREVLALPEGSGFSLSAYLAPAIGFVVALVALGFGVARWRRAGDRPAPPASRAAGPPDEDAERLDADIARYDL
jgi:cytochrome c-type biogenesis protein CcmH